MTRLTALLAVLFVATLGLVGGSASAGDDHPSKVFVCKYVGTPGDDERLQTGQNPISVSVNAIPDGASVGAFFADAQGRSFVLAFDTGQPEPSVDSCPEPDNPPDIEVTAGVTFTEATCTAGPSFSFVRGAGLGFYNVEGPLVDGKPIPGGTYTITANANEGYVLVGQSVWVHTFAAAPTNCGTPPPPFVCPDGRPPEANPVDPNDNCKRPTPPPVTTTPPAVTPPVVTPPVVTPPVVTPPVVQPPVKAKPPVKKATSKVKPPVKKKTAVVKKKPKMPPVCPVAKPYKGKCAVMGSG